MGAGLRVAEYGQFNGVILQIIIFNLEFFNILDIMRFVLK